MSNTALSKRDSQAPATTERADQTPIFTPQVDIRETESEVVLIADMPGVDESNVSIDLEGNELSIRGKLAEWAPEGYSLTYQEYTSGNYERTFTLGESIDHDGIKAVVKDGVLRLTLPKAREAQPRRIKVKTG